MYEIQLKDESTEELATTKNNIELNQHIKINNDHGEISSAPKVWKNYSTKIAFKGTKMADEKVFPNNLSFIPNKSTKIIQVNTWTNKKQHIIAMQFFYKNKEKIY